jgi:hypothetical protein
MALTARQTAAKLLLNNLKRAKLQIANMTAQEIAQAADMARIGDKKASDVLTQVSKLITPFLERLNRLSMPRGADRTDEEKEEGDEYLAPTVVGDPEDQKNGGEDTEE